MPDPPGGSPVPEPKLERKHQPLAPFAVFIRRLARNFTASLGIVVVSLALGTCGYCYFGELPFEDGFLNASMILTGMGPVDRMTTSAGKLFAAFYALYSGLAFLSMVAVLIAPIYHRFMHYFNVVTDEEEEQLTAVVKKAVAEQMKESAGCGDGSDI
jgi:hypothetical protein